MKLLLLTGLLMALAATTGAASALTNADVIKLTNAKLSPSLIVTAVDNCDPKFDVSPQGLIELSNSAVPQEVIEAMIKRASQPVKNSSIATSASPSKSPDLMSPADVLIVDGPTTTAMRYISPQMRVAVRGLGFGGVAKYAVLNGTAATARTKNSLPSFIVSVPKQAQPESYITVASLAVRRNNTREVMTGGGYMSYSSGIHPDRIIAITSEVSADQSKAQKGFIIYQVTPRKKLPEGEYAVVLYTSEMHGLVADWFTGASNSFFDFGVDH